MTFTAGTLCCVSNACVLIDTNGSESAETWFKIPHVTQISTTQTANTPKLVTSSTGGNETSACGTVANTGNLAIACHSGTGPERLCINGLYRLRWSQDCSNIWDDSGAEVDGDGSAVSDGEAGVHFEAVVRITSVPDDMNISANQAFIHNYSFDVVEWVTLPDCQAQEII
jgi:hypothetical protein